jgi:glutamine synthetase
MSKAVADILKLVKDKEITFVDFRFTDTKGKEAARICSNFRFWRR